MLMETDPTCLICRRQNPSDKAGAGTGDGGLVIYEDHSWLVRHSQETDIVGYLVLESRRHFLDLSMASKGAARSFGPLLQTTMQAMHAVLSPKRIYSFTLAEQVPHFHVHLIPRKDGLPKAFVGRGILAYPLEPAADAALVESTCASLKRAFKKQLALSQID